MRPLGLQCSLVNLYYLYNVVKARIMLKIRTFNH
jgi:hypothetical protein